MNGAEGSKVKEKGKSEKRLRGWQNITISNPATQFGWVISASSPVWNRTHQVQAYIGISRVSLYVFLLFLSSGTTEEQQKYHVPLLNLAKTLIPVYTIMLHIHSMYTGRYILWL